MSPELSVIIPVYNEKTTIGTILERVAAVPVSKEILIVDDGSTDGSRDVLSKEFSSRPEFRLIFHEKNAGKGAAIRTGIEQAAGECIIIQDADLEYDPMDYLVLLQALKQSGGNVVYGSRFLKKKKVTAYWHRFVNFFLTMLTNVLYGVRLTDMETCYKLIRRSVFKRIRVYSNGFEIEVELTAEIIKAGEKIVEVPISYHGRTFHEGKKIGWKDGLKAVQMLFYFRFCRATPSQ